MKKKSSTKQGSLKKIFIKFIRKMGYEVIDQSNLNIAGEDVYAGENLSKSGKTSISVPLGKTTISRKINSITIIIRSYTFGDVDNSQVMLDQNKNRIFELPKAEYTLRTINSIIKSCEYAKNYFNNVKFKIIITDDKSQQNILDKINSILDKSDLETKLIQIKNDELLDKIEKITEIPLMVLSLFMIPLLIGPFLWDMSEKEENVFLLLDIIIWLAFAIDMIVKVIISTNKIGYLKSHWLEVIAVIIPWFRPLRLVRLLVFALKSYKGITRVGKPDFLLVYAVGLVMISSTLVTTLEQGHNTPLASFSESLWWSTVTITTVGYGDMVPTTQIGRIVAVILMLGGIGIFPHGRKYKILWICHANATLTCDRPYP